MLFFLSEVQKLACKNRDKLRRTFEGMPILAHALGHAAYLSGMAAETALTHEVLPKAVGKEAEECLKKRVDHVRGQVWGKEYEPPKKDRKVVHAGRASQLARMDEQSRMDYLSSLTAEEVASLPQEFQIQASALRAKTVH